MQGAGAVLIFLPKLKSENVSKVCFIDKNGGSGRLMVCDENLLRSELNVQLRFLGLLLFSWYMLQTKLLNH